MKRNRTKAKTWRPWLPTEETRLEELRMAGRTVREIAADLGRTEAAVVCQLVRQGIRKPNLYHERWYAVLRKPHTTAEACRVMGCTAAAAKDRRRKLRRAGFDVPRPIRGDSA